MSPSAFLTAVAVAIAWASPSHPSPASAEPASGGASAAGTSAVPAPARLQCRRYFGCLQAGRTTSPHATEKDLR